MLTCSIRVGFAAALLLLFSVVLTVPAARAQSAKPLDLRVATFNLRFASTNQPNAWSVRRPVMRACIAEMAPDVMGTQEGVYHQLKDIAADSPDYDWIGLGRDGGSRGEFMAVFYRKARLEPVEFDHFWLSDTPNVIASTNWGNTNRRMTTWVRFRERSSQREFYVFNTHLDHALRPAREKGARLIRQRVQEVHTRHGVGEIGKKIEAGEVFLEPGKLPGRPPVLNDSFPERLHGINQHGMGALTGFKVRGLSRQPHETQSRQQVFGGILTVTQLQRGAGANGEHLVDLFKGGEGWRPGIDKLHRLPVRAHQKEWKPRVPGERAHRFVEDPHALQDLMGRVRAVGGDG